MQKRGKVVRTIVGVVADILPNEGYTVGCVHPVTGPASDYLVEILQELKSRVKEGMIDSLACYQKEVRPPVARF